MPLKETTREAAGKLDALIAAMERGATAKPTHLETQKAMQRRLKCSRGAVERLLDLADEAGRLEIGKKIVHERGGKPKTVTGFAIKPAKGSK